MAVGIGSRSRFKAPGLLAALALTMSMAGSGWVSAQEATKASLPDFVIEEFGQPPVVPEGPLTEELQAAVQVAFVDSMVSSLSLIHI